METLAEEYPDVEFYAWDVVNEAFSEQGTMREAGSSKVVSGQSAWVQVFGDDSFMNYAFKFARMYAPEGCKLFYNDYNEYSPKKRDGIYNKLKELVAEGNIDGVGMQSHIGMSYPSTELYEEAFRKYNELGLEIHVTELDIDQKSNSQEAQLELAQRYQDIFRLYKKLVNDGVNITAVITWGISDNNSWIGGYPNLFDADYQAKDAFYAVADTGMEIQKIKTANALSFDGTDMDFEKAFKIQKENEIGSAGSFKAVWNKNSVTLRISSGIDGTATVIFSNSDGTTTEKTADVKKNESQDITIDLSEIKNGGSADMEIIMSPASGKNVLWNTLNYKNEYVFGKLYFLSQPLTAEAALASSAPIIDGTVDDIWQNASPIDINKYTMGKDGAYGTAKMLWDGDYIYVLVDVKDKKLSKASANAYEQDTVEIFLDENNGKTSTYEADDVQLRINYDNEVTITDGKSADGYITAAKTTSDGYIVEAAIPYTISPFSADQVVGFDVQINDDGDGEGKRTGIANWSNLTGQGYINTSGFGVLELKSGSASAVKGDINLDGKVNTADLVLLQKYLVNAVKTLNSATAADINEDNTVNVFDAVLLRSELLK